VPFSIVEPQVIVRDVLQLATLAAVLNGEHNWRPYWDRLLPNVGPPRWTRRSPFRRFSSFGITISARYVRRDFRKQLLEFIEAWRDAEERFQVFWQNYPSLAEKLRLSCRNSRLELLLGPDGEPVLAPVSGWQAVDVGIFLACWEFLDFIQNPLRGRLGKCWECERYYLAIRSSPNKSFCSTRCHRSGSPKLSMRRKRAEIRRKKMDQIQKALELLASSQESVSDWKEWVAKQAGVNKGWLTKEVNEGRLSAPDSNQQERPKEAP